MVVERATERINRTSLRERRDEVERLLVTRGLARGPRRLLPRTPPAAQHQGDYISRLREVLEGLGPVFCSFGLYLASRVDLLSSRDCLELAEIQDRAQPSAPDVVRALIQREIGRSLDDVFLSFEESPFESRLLFQKHRACLKDGRKVTIKVVRAETEEQLIQDLELLPLLKFALGTISTYPAVDSAMDDFRFMLLRKIDLTQEANSLDALTRNAETFGLLRPASLEQALCTRGMLTVECLPGGSLGELLSHSFTTETAYAGSFPTDDLARRLCVLWLRQALHGSVFPVELSPDDLVVLPGRQIGLTGGTFGNLSHDSRSNLWSYLIATASESPNQACAFLVKELKRSESLDSDSELQQRFRQVVPFRDTDWSGDFFADHLFVQWRLANEHGYMARQNLPSFFRGLYTIARLARQLSPQHDAFAQALEDVRLIARMEWFKEMLGPDQFGKQMNQYAALMLELPQRLDEALTLVAEERTQSRLPMRETYEPGSRQSSSAILVALLLMLAAFVMLGQHAGALNGSWADSIKALVFVALGAGVLRAASRA
jgi:ubiquinone biosynthesis protein